MDRLLAPGGYTVVDGHDRPVARLRSEGYLTGLLTNTFAEFRPTMERDIDFALFDVVVESFAVGSPQARASRSTRATARPARRRPRRRSCTSTTSTRT